MVYSKKDMSKIVITGTGRCGTSFLMQFFTYLGLKTGYTVDECDQHLARSNCNGGIEHSIGTELFENSHIVKNPIWLYEPELLDFDIDFIIVPVRKIEHVAESRNNIGDDMYGGFWKGAKNSKEQIEIDSKAFYNFINYTVKKDLKVIFLDFPRIIHDSEYLYNKIGDKLGVYLRPWSESFNEIARPEKVHI